MKKNTSKQEIMNKAYDLFINNGYNNVSVNDICKEMDISKTTFYYYLNSKDDIIRDFYNTVSDEVMDKFVDIFDEEDSYKQLQSFFTVIISRSMKIGPDLASQMMIMNLNKDQHSFDMREKLTKLGTSIVRKGQKNGTFLNKNDPKTLYTACAYLFTGYEFMWCVKEGNIDWLQEMNNTFEAILDVVPKSRKMTDR